MKLKTIFISLIIVSVLIFTCGCVENNGDEGGVSKKTIMMTAEEFQDNMETNISENSFSMLYTSLEDGDTLVIQYIITKIEYDSETDVTTISFEWSKIEDGGTLTTSVHFQFEGDISQDFSVFDSINITVHIKHVKFSVNGFEYNLEIFEEQWENEEYFSENVPNFLLIHQGLKPLSPESIKKTSGAQDSTEGSILFFDVTPDEILLGETAMLSWNVTGATSVTIDNGIGTLDPVGNITISPIQTTTYTLTADFSTDVIIGSNKATATITVSSGLPITISMTISEWDNDDNKITWNVTGVEGGPVTSSEVDAFIVDESGHIVSGQMIEKTPGLISQGITFTVTAPSDGHYIFKITEKGFGDTLFESSLTKY